MSRSGTPTPDAASAARAILKPFTTSGVRSNDCTATIQAALNAAAGSFGVVELPPGIYPVQGLTIPNYVTLRGTSGGAARFGRPFWPGYLANGSTVLTRIDDAHSGTLLTMAGVGAGVQDLVLDGARIDGTSPNCDPALVDQSFESRISNVRIIAWPGIGLDVQYESNSKWSEIQISKCGLTTGPAMRIVSLPVGIGGTVPTNQLDIYDLSIEQPYGSGLDIGFDPTVDGSGNISSNTDMYYVEAVRLVNLHVEMQNSGATNSLPGVRIGNVWHVDILNPSFNWGPTTAIYYDQMGMTPAVPTGTRHYQDPTHWGHVTVTSGNIRGGNGTGYNADHLIECNRGDDFKILGTTIDRWLNNAGAIQLNSAFGRFFIDPTVSSSDKALPTGNVMVNDQRTGTIAEQSQIIQPIQFNRDLTAAGHLNGPPSGSALIGAWGEQGGRLGGGAVQAPEAYDSRGRIMWATGASTAAGTIISVTFRTAYARYPTVVITPMNPATAALGLSLAGAATAAGFSVAVATACAANQPAQTYGFYYTVIG